MKKILLLATISLSVLYTSAQTYESVKQLALLTQFQKAKDELDKGMGNSKFASKAEAYMLKTWIYSSLAIDPKNKETAEGERLMNEADAAFAKYKEMDPKLSLVEDAAYQSGPINLYTALFNSGYKEYTNKNWELSFDRFKKVVDLSDLLIKQKVITISMDTNSVVMAGITAENAKRRDDAAIYYSRLADIKIPGDDYEGIYRFLVSYYFGKKDMTAFEKYKAIGEQLYPKSDYFKFDKIDFAIGLMDNFDDKVKALDAMIAANPNDYKANQALGEIIYDTLNPRKGDPPAKAEADELEKKMVAAFTKAGTIQPNTVNAYLYLGDHFISKAVSVGEKRDAVLLEIQKRTKPGAQPTKEDAAKRDAADKSYGDALELAREPYEKAAAIYAAKSTPLDARDKQQYKKAVGYLSDIYAYKKSQAKGNAADVAKYTAGQKKWDDLYETLK